MLEVVVNGARRAIVCDSDTPLLWVIRDELHFTGTKFGCGVGACGACTVLMNGSAVRGCMIPIQSANGAEVVTIEGLPAMSGGNRPPRGDSRSAAGAIGCLPNQERTWEYFREDQ